VRKKGSDTAVRQWRERGDAGSIEREKEGKAAVKSGSED
jgi:hypothetical protein